MNLMPIGSTRRRMMVPALGGDTRLAAEARANELFKISALKEPDLRRRGLLLGAVSGAGLLALSFGRAHAAASTSPTIAATGRVSVLAYGADPTGTNDSTTAFQNAMAAGPAVVPATVNGSAAVYKVTNCVVPSGGVLIGDAPPGYVGGGVNSSTSVNPRIIGATSATRIFNVDAKKAIYFRGLFIDGSNASSPFTTDGISAGSNSMTVEDCLIANCNNGIGGTVTSQAYNWVCYSKNNTISTCVTGIGQLLDSWVLYSDMAECTNGIKFASGDSAIVILGCRVEWNGRSNTGNSPGPNNTAGYGMDTNGANGIQIIGCNFDANGNGGIYFNNAFECSATGNFLQRNGVNVTSPPSGTTLIANSCNMEFNAAFSIFINGNHCTPQNDGSVWGPCAFAHFDGTAGNNNALIFTGNDMSGYQGSTAGATNLSVHSSNTLWFTGTLPTSTGVSGIVVKNNLGTGTSAQDVDTR